MRKSLLLTLFFVFLITLGSTLDLKARDVIDIDNDGHTGLAETIYSLQVVAGIQEEGWHCQDDDLVNGIYRVCNYFPLTPGNQWNYTTGNRVTLATNQTCSTGMSGVNLSTSGYEFEMIIQNKEQGLIGGCNFQLPERVFRDFGVSVTIIDPEMSIGETKVHSYFDGGATFTTTLVGFEQVVVPSGTYNALKYEVLTNDTEACSFKTTLWLVKNLGPVKIHRTNANPSNCMGCMFVCRPDNNFTIVNTPAELIQADVDGVRY